MTPIEVKSSLVGVLKGGNKKLLPGKPCGSFFMGFVQYIHTLQEKRSKRISKDNQIISNGLSIDVSQFKLSDGEIHYLYWFIQGSIMVPYIRQRLRRAWGFCERHAWGYIFVEAAFYRGFMHGASILYEDLLSLGLSAFNIKGPLKNWRVMKNLISKGPCPMCEMGFGPYSKGIVRPEIIERGRDITELYALARKTETYWEKTICGKCIGNKSNHRCRRHLIEDISNGLTNQLSNHQALVDYIYCHISLYSRSFRLEFQGSQTEEDMSALISAVGWCSGWKTFLSLYGKNGFLINE
jgi:hypothetical protein